MNDKELADKIVALGVGSLVQGGSKDQTKWFRTPRSYSLGNDFPFYTKQFVRDWRVYGALYQLKNPNADVRQMIEELVDA